LATGWMTGVQFSAGDGRFFRATVSRSALGATQPRIQWVLEVKCLEREADS